MDSSFQADRDVVGERDSDNDDERPNNMLDLTGTKWFSYFDCIDENLNVPTDIINDAVRIQYRPWEKETISLTLDDWREVGYTISRCKKLEVIFLHYGSITEEILVALFQADGNYDFPLRVLDLRCNGFGTEGVSAILPFLRSRKELKHLLLSHNNIDNRGATLLAEVLDPMPVEYLDVSCNAMDHEGMERIICHCEQSWLVLSGQFSITTLPFTRAVGVGTVRHVAIGNCEYKIDPNIVKFQEGLDLESVKTLSRCLKRAKATAVTINTNIWPFNHDEDEDAKIHKIISEEITSIVSDTSSFDAFCGSSHIIQCFYVQDQNIAGLFLPPSVAALALEINKRTDISINQRLRCKLRSIYFHEVFSLLPFLQMKRVWIPYVLELMTISEERLPDEDREPKLTDEELLEFMIRDLAGEEDLSHQDNDDENGMNLPKFVMSREGNLNGTYHFIRNWNLPTLFDNQL